MMMRKQLLAWGCIGVVALGALFIPVRAAAPHDPRTPIIVADTELQNQSGPIPTTILFTPTADDDFRMSIYMDWPTDALPSTGGTLVGSWTDDTQPNPYPIQFGVAVGPCNANSIYGPAQASSMIRAKANTPITFNFSQVCSGGVPAPYNLYIVLERL
jgi:hypothetical protein